jgi:hypothetical protein
VRKKEIKDDKKGGRKKSEESGKRKRIETRT